MKIVSIAMGVVGLALVIVGAVRAHRNRIQPDPENSDVLVVKVNEGAFDMWLSIAGATVTALGGIVGSFG